MSSVESRQSSAPAIPGQKGGPRFWRGSFALMSAMVFWFAAAHAQSGAAKDAPDKVLGTWLTDSGNLEIEIARCGEALCGKVTKVLANRSMSGSGEMVSADKRDPLGMTLLKDFKPSGEGEWSGEIYNRENAKTYLKEHPQIGEQVEQAIRGNAGLVADAMMAAPPGEAAAEE